MTIRIRGIPPPHTSVALVTELGSQKEKSFAKENEGAQLLEMP